MANPIIQRELVSVLRSRKALAAQVLLVMVLAILVVLRWPEDARADLTGLRSMQVLRVFGYGLGIAMLLIAPVFPATSVVMERQRGTLALLLNSPMSGWHIFIGKLLAVLGFVALLLLLSVPIAAAFYTLPGIDLWGHLGRLYLILALMAIQYTALALLVSSFASTNDSAMRMTYGLVLLLCVGAMLPQQFLQRQSWFDSLLFGAGLSLIDWLRCISPVAAMMEVLGHGNVAGFGLRGIDNVTQRYTILCAITSPALALWTTMRLNHNMLDRARTAGKVTDERSFTVRVLRRVMFLWFFDPNRRRGLIGNRTNPVMAKEFRSRRFGASHWMMRLIAMVMVVSLLLMLAATKGSQQWGVPALGGIIAIMQIALIVLLTPSLAAGLISAERESGGWQLLQTTPLKPHTIVIGKLLSVLWPLLLVLLATLPGYAVLIYIRPDMAQQVLSVLTTLVLTALVSLLVSAAASSLCSRTTTAIALSYAILITVCGGTMFIWLGEDAPFDTALVQKVLKFNPLAAALSLLEAPGFEQYHLVPGNWWIMGIACVVCLLVLWVRTWQLTRPR